ncbi:MAG: 6-carboxytetrahydropterin synthase QueD [Crocinitomicaceae bacterium]|nr:6-carboxytetrahydropterin synthase QueD [Crocinitomicaceae bacterium]|tara:strand:+ start:18293 stop:18730 length:438 start_codon:yes stop_codon:yes gene_type:complete
MNVRITKQFNFEAAHALDGYEGKCKDIHGHSYHLKVTFLGKPKNDNELSDCGMVVDFGEVKKVVKTYILPIFDHRLILRKDTRFQEIAPINERIRLVDYQPTCENMLIEIVQILQTNKPKGTKLVKAFLRETANSYAEWLAEDNS